MSDIRQQTPIPVQRQTEQPVTGWVGIVFFAGAMMVVIGAVHAIEGLVALLRPTYYLVTPDRLIVSTSYTAWGWFQLVVGVVVAVAGVALFSGSTWSRVAAVTVAGLSGIVNLMFMSAYPWWSLTALALDVLVIYAVTVHGAEARRR